MNKTKRTTKLPEPVRVNPWVSTWDAHIAGIFIFVLSLAHFPARIPALNSFDPPKRLVWAILAVVFLGCALFKKDQRWNRIPLSILLLLGWMLLRTWLRPVPLREVEVLFSWLQPLLLFVAGRLWVSSERPFRFEVLGRWLLLSGFLQAGYMIFQYLGHDPFFGETISAFDYKPARMIGSIGYQNQAVDFICVTCAGIWLAFRKRPMQWTALCAVGVVIALSANRGGFLAFLLAITGVYIYGFFKISPNADIRFSLKQILTMVGLCLLCGFGVSFFPEFRERFGSLLHHVDQNIAVQSRLWMHRVAWDLWADAPLQGVGAGGFAYNFLSVLTKQVPAVKTHELLVQLVFAREAHFDLLQFAAEFGIIGVAGLLWVMKDVIGSYKYIRGKENERCRQALLWVAVYMGISSLFTFSWQSSAAGPAAGFLLGLLLPVSSTHILLKGRTFRWMFPFTLAGASFLFFLGLTVWNLRTPWLITNSRAEKAVEEIPAIYDRYRAVAGAALAREGNLETGLRTLQEVQNDYLDLLVWNNQANIYMQQGDWEQAIGYYRQWAETGIMHSEALLNLSIAYEKTGMYLEAAETLSVQMNLWPPDELDRIQRVAVLFFQAGEMRKTQHVINKYYGIWRELPKNQQALLWNLRGAVYMKEAEWKNAEEAFLAAVDLDPSLQSARLNLQHVRSRL